MKVKPIRTKQYGTRHRFEELPPLLDSEAEARRQESMLLTAVLELERNKPLF